jgi:pimeloyl-ACP methyl ester carboxylesterase
VRVDEHTIDLGGSPVFYRSATPANRTDASAPAREADSPSTLYLHGVPTSSDDWLPFLERAGGIAPDLIGFGRSGKSGHLDYSIDAYADFVETFLTELRIDRLQLVAHDWGAVPGLVFAQRHPDRITKLVLINAVPLLDGFTWHRLARTWRRPLLGELVMGSITKRLFTRTLKRAAPFSNERLNAIWEQFDQGTQRAILRLHRDASEAKLAQAGAGLERLRVPTLILWGTSDAWLSPEWGEAYAARLTQASLQQVPDAGHWPWLDQPTVIEQVAGFLQ